MEGKRVLGIDENGLGPLLGPLVVTGTLLKFKNSPVSWFEGIADSKLFFKTRSKNNFSLIEETVISFFSLAEKKMPSSPAEIFYAFTRNMNCPHAVNICSGRIPSKFMWADSEKTWKRCLEFSRWAEEKGIEIESIYSDFICPFSLNQFTKTHSKLFLDFVSFCKIMKAATDKNNLDVQTGKIGGLKFYSPYLRHVMNECDTKIISEKGERSLYSLRQKEVEFKLGFFMDVEKKSFPAAISSIIGKYIRELSMFSIRESLGIKNDISGYHDRKTKRLTNDINLGRIPRECVFRNK